MVRTHLLAAGFVALTVCTSNSFSQAGLLLVVNKRDQTLGIVDPEAKQQIATVPLEAITGQELAVSPNGKLAFVPIYGDSSVGLPGTDGNQIVVVDLGKRQVSQTIFFSHPVRPHSAVFGPKDGLLYVTTELDDSVAVIDQQAKVASASSTQRPESYAPAIIGAIPTGQEQSHMLALSPDGRYGYTANVGSGTVSVLEMKTRKKLAVISVAPKIDRISVSPNGRWVFTSDMEKPRLAAIGTKSDKVEHWVELPGTGYGAVATADSRWLLVAVPEQNQVVVIDLSKWRVVRTVQVPSSPLEILLRPDGKVAYVSCDRSGKIAALRLKDWSVSSIGVGRSPEGLGWAK